MGAPIEALLSTAPWKKFSCLIALPLRSPSIQRSSDPTIQRCHPIQLQLQRQLRPSTERERERERRPLCHCATVRAFVPSLSLLIFFYPLPSVLLSAAVCCCLSLKLPSKGQLQSPITSNQFAHSLHDLWEKIWLPAFSSSVSLPVFLDSPLYLKQ